MLFLALADPFGGQNQPSKKRSFKKSKIDGFVRLELLELGSEHG
jgi:hypothetical protein